ncbi:MAG: AbgT family transporter [bacterium]|nr:AbgT family transporter [bacterium]
MTSQPSSESQGSMPSGILGRFLDLVEKVGNKLPDPAFLFLICLVLAWVFSAIFAGETFETASGPASVTNQLSGEALVAFMTGMVGTFMNFFPVGVVLVAMLGFGVAEKSGFINTGLKIMLMITPKKLLTPMLTFVAIISHTAVDAGYVLVIPIGGILFYAAGRHPVAGLCAAFAGVSGGFSANFMISAIDAILQGLTQGAAQIIDNDYEVSILCNWYFAAASGVVVILLIWFLTDRIIEPRLQRQFPIDDDAEIIAMEKVESRELVGFVSGLVATLALVVALVFFSLPADSLLRAPDGQIGTIQAPLMRMIVPLLFVFALLPGVVHGLVAGTIRSSKDIVDGMVEAMKGLGHYFVIMFFAAQFVYVFNQSNLGAWLAISGADTLKGFGLPASVTIVGAILLTAFVNLILGSASAKWGLLSVILVPLLMQLGIAPEYAQAAYRVGDSTTNIITPLMPYFPLVVVYCQRYYKKTGIGTLLSLMLPYSLVLLIGWTIFMLLYSMLGIPLGPDSGYEYVAPK